MSVILDSAFDYEREPKMVITVCNLCGNDCFASVADVDRYGLPVRTVRCSNCGLVFLNPRMTEAAYSRFYRTGAYRMLLSKFYGRPITPRTIETEQAAYAKALIPTMTPLFGSRAGGTLLDVGGSTGVVAEVVAKEFFCSVVVLEPSRAEAERARSRGLEVAQMTLKKYDPTRRYNGALLCQTVDHLTDIMGSLRKIRGMLRMSSPFFIDIVVWKDQPDQIKVDHPFYLTEETACLYLCRAGFRRVSTQLSEDQKHMNFLCRAI